MRMAAVLLIGLLGACTASGGDRGGDSSAAGASAAAPDTTTAADTAVPAVAGTPGRTFHVVGNEPFWSLDITAGGLRFRTPEDTTGALFSAATRSAAGDTVTWTAAAGGRTIDARLWPAKCSDGMSDREWTHTALVRVDTTTYRGCAAQT